ncbi:MAG: M1 family metallopeptidase, partial [Candidatus Aminicenantales bacterium]
MRKIRRPFTQNLLPRVLLIAIISTASSPPLMSLPKDLSACPQVANYVIDVTLDPEDHTLSGRERLRWTNTTDFPAEELWFHLYWNAFQNNKSTFLKEGRERWGRIFRKNRKQDWGFCRVDAIRVTDVFPFSEADLKPGMRFRHPDDDNVHDQTVFSVRLPQPVMPGRTIELLIEFHARVPRPIHRTGVHKDYYFIAQWFPKIGVFEEGRWNCHQFHATSNFYADFGTYDVRITLPSSFVVGATGELKENRENPDGTTIHRFYQQSVHDFAWTASPHFRKHVTEVTLPSGRRTRVILLLQPYHAHLKQRYETAVIRALRACSAWYGEYPYATVTCVDPAYNSRSGGMEYPTLFTAGAYFLAPEGVPRPEGVTIHEFGHGYFYGLVATNEFEYAWMDEGFTSFLDSEVYYSAYGPPFYSRTYFGIPVRFKEVRIPVESSGISRHRQTYDRDVMQNVTWHFLDRASYGAQSYAKAELMLRTLKRFIGKDLFAQMIKAYSLRYWFQHPRPEDFFSVVSEFCGRDMRPFLIPFVYASEKLDYSVGSITNIPIPPPQGWFGDRYVSSSTEEADSRLYRSEVLVRRLGGMKVPVEILVTFEDG